MSMRDIVEDTVPHLSQVMRSLMRSDVWLHVSLVLKKIKIIFKSLDKCWKNPHVHVLTYLKVSLRNIFMCGARQKENVDLISLSLSCLCNLI